VPNIMSLGIAYSVGYVFLPRDASAERGNATVSRPSVCLSVCLSVRPSVCDV